MQSNAKNRVLFLEDWLRSAAASSSGAPAPPPPPAAISARSILQAWAELRDPSLPFSDPNPLVSALQILDAARFSLHIADPQAKLLISHLSSDQALPSDSLPLILRLLYFWLRKTPRASPSLLNSAASVLSHLFSARPHCPALLVLLLGALAATPSINVSCRRDCLDLLCLRLELARFEEELIAELLAGIGYSLSRSDDPYFSKLLSFLLRIGNGGSPSASVYHGLMILHLSEWLVTGFVNLTSLGKMESISGELSGPNWEGKSYSPFAVAMTSAGVLRALRMVPSKNRAISIIPDMRSSVENSITSVANHALLSDSNNASDGSHLLQCISIGVSRAGLLPFSAPLLMALNRALLTEIFPFAKFCRLSLEIQNENSINIVLEKLKGHLQSIIFKEAGAITSAFCHQYASADDTHKVFVESSVWNCSLEFYTNIRAVALLHRTKNDQLLGYLEKFGEAAFLMIVVYAAEVASQKLNPKSSHEIRPEVSVQILMAFSCIEYMRRVRLPEYTDVVRRAVLAMQEHAALCISFVESMPPYVELTNKQGLFTLEGARYVWFEDEVQTARMLFYLRVIPTCINLIPASVFGKLVAPTMFLYLQHPNEKVARASHSVFAALMSSGKDSDRDERLDLKEKLVFYYTQRALEAWLLELQL
ncbi:hypothetical protein KSP40_PGU017048 [Platanthera guangdongensis]|uniref:Uncharacterized protein n=1 Tax=Platanthera guangdongensis TaxID=2320717 RepID=A0ABR2LNK4_9ASPA